MSEKITIKKNQGPTIKRLSSFLKQFHLLIFFVIMAGLLSVVVIMISRALTEASTTNYTSDISAGSIDQSTLERIQSLHTSDQPTANFEMPPGRVNPFGE